MLFTQREEELAKERARAEQMKQEREITAQKEEAERQARKKVCFYGVLQKHSCPLYFYTFFFCHIVAANKVAVLRFSVIGHHKVVRNGE